MFASGRFRRSYATGLRPSALRMECDDDELDVAFCARFQFFSTFVVCFCVCCINCINCTFSFSVHTGTVTIVTVLFHNTVLRGTCLFVISLLLYLYMSLSQRCVYDCNKRILYCIVRKCDQCHVENNTTLGHSSFSNDECDYARQQVLVLLSVFRLSAKTRYRFKPR